MYTKQAAVLLMLSACSASTSATRLPNGIAQNPTPNVSHAPPQKKNTQEVVAQPKTQEVPPVRQEPPQNTKAQPQKTIALQREEIKQQALQHTARLLGKQQYDTFNEMLAMPNATPEEKIVAHLGLRCIQEGMADQSCSQRLRVWSLYRIESIIKTINRPKKHTVARAMILGETHKRHTALKIPFLAMNIEGNPVQNRIVYEACMLMNETEAIRATLMRGCGFDYVCDVVHYLCALARVMRDPADYSRAFSILTLSHHLLAAISEPESAAARLPQQIEAYAPQEPDTMRFMPGNGHEYMQAAAIIRALHTQQHHRGTAEDDIATWFTGLCSMTAIDLDHALHEAHRTTSEQFRHYLQSLFAMPPDAATALRRQTPLKSLLVTLYASLHEHAQS